MSTKNAMLKLLVIVKHGGDGISIEYPPLKCIDGLNTSVRCYLLPKWESLTLRADSWLVNFTNTVAEVLPAR